MLLQIIKLLLPIITSLLVGVYCKKSKILDDNANEKIKNLLNNVILPLVLFNSFLFADYNKKSAVYILSPIVAMGIAYLIATLVKKFFIKEYSDFFPEHVVTWEGGTIGISLATLLLGTYGTQHMALFDFGHAMFLFGFVVPILAVKDGGTVKPKQLIKTIFSARTFDFAILGALCGILGLAKFINTHEAVGIFYHGIVDIIVIPATFLILVTVGYSINVDKKLIVPLFSMCIARLIFMTISFIIAYVFITRFVVMEKNILLVLLIGYALPPTYALQIFTTFKGRKYMNEFSSAFTSVTTIITLILFVFISIYAHI